MKRLGIVTSLVFGLACAAAGQPVPGSFAGSRTPSIWFNRDSSQYKPMEMKSANVDVKVRGHLATTTVEMTFFNPNARVLEGEFVFPLAKGQTVSGYALDIEGKMRQAVVVEKQQGRTIFEEIVRRGVDPGLAELTRGNVFRTRIYPLFANNTRRVAVTFEQELNDEGETFGYTLPMALPEKLEQFRARVEVVKSQEAPTGKNGAGELLKFQRIKDSYVAEYSTKEAKSLRLPAFSVRKRTDRTGIFLVRDKGDASRLYFHARVEPKLPEPPALAPPRRIALFYDASGSAAQRDRGREMEFLEAWMQHLGNVKVDLVVVRNDAETPVPFEVKDGDASALRKALEQTVPDGGTSLGAVDVNLTAEADMVALMSDGFSTFGPSEPTLRRKDGTAPAFLAIHAAALADSANLERLARSVHGRVVDLQSRNAAEAVADVGHEPFRFLRAKVVSGTVENLAPTGQVIVTRDFVIAGRSAGRAEVDLEFGYGGKVTMTHRLVLEPEDALAAERGLFIRRAWAQCRLAELALEPERNASAMVALGKEYGIVTAGTSLMVLERMDDYVRYGLEPREPELRAKYAAAVANGAGGARPVNEATLLNQVERQWAYFKSWHEKEHPWLESVIQQAAEREAAMYGALSVQARAGQTGTFLRTEDAAAAEVLVQRANDLAGRWQEAKAKEDTRAAWVREATNVLRAVNALREQRYQQSPQLDEGALRARGSVLNISSGGMMMSGSGGGFGRGTGLGGFGDNLTVGASAVMTGTVTLSGGADLAMATNGATISVAAPPAARAAGESTTTPAAATLSGEDAIQMKTAESDALYLDTLKDSPDAVAAYVLARGQYAADPAFFSECAEFFREKKKDERMALRILSNLAEMEMENATLLRMLAFRLRHMGRHDLAAPVLQEVLKIRGEEPQSRRDLALCLLALKSPDYARAATLLWEVVRKPWDFRFPGIQLTALHELNDLLQHVPEDCPKERRPDPAAMGMDKRLLANVPVALRVVVTWDTDNTDIDFWVTDPSGEVCASNRNRTQTGGMMSPNFAGGYGPEVFTIRTPLPGTYTVMVRMQRDLQQKRSGPPTVQVEMQRDFNATGAGARRIVTRRMEEPYVAIEVGAFVVKPDELAAR